MGNFLIIKRLSPYILGGIITTTMVGFIIPSGLFIVGALTAGVLFVKVYLQGVNSYLELDFSFLLSIIIISISAFLLIKSGCMLMPENNNCSHNQLRATIFAVFAFPFLIGTVIWVVIRLPMIVRSLMTKR